MELAFRHDWLVLVEEMIEGREVELGVLGNADPIVSVPGEILIANDSEWYDFAAKYDEGGMRLGAPADLPTEVTAALRTPPGGPSRSAAAPAWPASTSS